MKKLLLYCLVPCAIFSEVKTLDSSRSWLVEKYLPSLTGRVLYVGVGDYTQSYYRRVQQPRLFETIDFDSSKARFGSPYKHHIAEFATFDPGYKYDHISLFGVLNDETITEALNHAHHLLKVGGTLQVGQDRDFWFERFTLSPFDMFETLFEGICKDNVVWWGIKVKEKHSKYFVAVKKNQERALETLDQYVGLLAPRNRFYADPMLFKHKGVNYLFFEDYDYKKGIISFVTVDENLQFSSPEKALELPYHLSFPYIFEEDGHIYMTPETYDINEVVLLEAEEFPHKWKKVRTLVSGKKFADPILFKHDGYYWLFTAHQCDLMCIYYAESLAAEFKPHPINARNVRGRNAGGVFISEGRLIRPVMDNAEGYGGAMSLKEVVLLNPLEFIEREIRHIDPTWAPNLDGTHTYNQNEDLIVYDGRRTIFPTEDASYSQMSRSY